MSTAADSPGAFTRIEVVCSCTAKLAIKVKLAGQTITCPKCKSELTVPEPNAVSGLVSRETTPVKTPLTAEPQPGVSPRSPVELQPVAGVPVVDQVVPVTESDSGTQEVAPAPAASSLKSEPPVVAHSSDDESTPTSIADSFESPDVLIAFRALTDRQRQVYTLIHEGVTRGRPPTIREIAKQMGISSPNGVKTHMTALEKKGLIRRDSAQARAIQLIGVRTTALGAALTSPETSLPESLFSDRQLQIFRFLEQFIRTNGFSPSVRQIGDEFGIRSPNGVSSHLKAIEKKGAIRREGSGSRNITIIAEVGDAQPSITPAINATAAVSDEQASKTVPVSGSEDDQRPVDPGVQRPLPMASEPPQSPPVEVAAPEPEKQTVPLEIPDWVAKLQETALYRSQHDKAGRRPPAHDLIAQVLAVLAASRGVASYDSLKSKIGSRFRPGAVPVIIKVLNFDGVEVLSHKPNEEVRLNFELLEREFGVELRKDNADQ